MEFGPKVKPYYHKDPFDMMSFSSRGVHFWAYETIKPEPPYAAGYKYQIVLIKKNWKNIVLESEQFEGCLLDPQIYAQSVKENGYIGYIGKVFSGSWKYFNDKLTEELKGKRNGLIVDQVPTQGMAL